MPRPLPSPRLLALCIALPSACSPPLHAANPGDILWNYNAGADVYSSPAVSSTGIVYFGTSKSSTDVTASRILSLTPGATSATLRWAYTVPGTYSLIDASPTLSADGSMLFAGSWNNSVYALNTSNGTLRWSYATASYISSSPALGSDGTVYITSGDGFLYALNPTATAALRLKWSFLSDGTIAASPAIGPDNSIVFATLGGTVTAVTSTGLVKWTRTVPTIAGRDSRIRASPAIAPDGTVYVGSGNYFFYALDGATGAIKWSFETLAEVDSTAAVGPTGTVYFASRAGEFYAFDAEGVFVWGQALGEIFYSSTAIDANGNVYIPCFSGNNTSKVYAFDPSGTTLWVTTLPTVIDASPVITTDGKLYIGGYDNKLYALHTGVGPATEGWPKFRRSLDNAARVPPGVAPAITLSPTGSVLLAGEPFTLNASATGTIPLNYIWRRNGVVLTDTLGAVFTRAVSTAADAGTYDVLVVNTFGSATTTVAPLTIGGPLTSTTNDLTWTIYRPSSAQLTATVEKSTDLTTWSTSTVTTAVQSEANTVQTVRATTPLSPNGRTFLRLRKTP